MSTIQYKADQKTIQEIINLYEKDHLNLEPGFQRSSVWADRDRQKLIDSILRNYPLPSIFLYRRCAAAIIPAREIGGEVDWRPDYSEFKPSNLF